MVGNSAAYKPMYLIDYINAWRKVYNTTIKQCGMYFMAKKYDMFGNVCGGVLCIRCIMYVYIRTVYAYIYIYTFKYDGC